MRLNPADAQARLATIDLELDQHRPVLRAMRDLHAKLAADREAMGRTQTAGDHYRDAKLKESLSGLVLGIAPEVGVFFEELSPFVGKPGIAELERIIAALEAEREELSAALSAFLHRWPTATTMRPYRYIGREGKHRLEDGRMAEPGEIVELNQRQAHSLRDRFEPVELEPAAEPVAAAPVAT